MSIGSKVRALRKERELSTYQLATMASVTQTTISHLETNKLRSPKYSTLVSIANALNVSVIDLLPLEDTLSTSILRQDELAFLELFRQFDQDQRKAILQVLHSLKLLKK